MALVMARKWAGKPLLAIGLVPLLQCVVQSQGDCDRGFAVDFGGRDCHGRIRIRSARWPSVHKERQATKASGLYRFGGRAAR